MRNVFFSLLFLVYCAACSPGPSDIYINEIEDWRTARIAELRSPEGFLDLAGLYWLDSGRNTIGSSQKNDIVFPADFPEDLGELHLFEGIVTYAGNGPLKLEDDQPVNAGDTLFAEGNSKEIFYEHYRFYLIRRADEIGIRLKDLEHPNLSGGPKIPYFPIDDRWRVNAKFEPFDEPKTLMIQNIVGLTYPVSCPGKLSFKWQGNVYSLEPTTRGKEFFITFGDATNGVSTYGAGRYLYADMPDEGDEVIIDFNKAYNPPCAFTEYATCPLPPPQNRLAFAIPAGEKDFHWNEDH